MQRNGKIYAMIAALLAMVAATALGAGFDRLNSTIKLGQGTVADKTIEFDVGASPNPKIVGLAAGTGITSSVNFSVLDHGEVRVLESTSNGANYIALKAPASLSGDTTYTLPADGANGALLQTNGSGTLAWLAGGAINTIFHGGGVTSTPTWSALVNADVDAAAAIARSKIAAGTADHVVINAASTGVLSSEAALSAIRGGTGVSNNVAATTTRSGNFALTETLTGTTSVTLPTSGTLVGSADTGTVSSTMVLDGTLLNIDVNASAAIARSKLAAGTADHVVINAPTTGLFSSEAQLDKTRGGTGVSSTATFPTSGVVVTEAATETLTNKTLTSPKVNENVVTTTLSTQLNYLNGATGTTGTPSTNVVFSTSPTIATPALTGAWTTTGDLTETKSGGITTLLNNTATTGSNILILRNGNGTSSSRSAYTEYNSNETSDITWDVGMLGSSVFKIQHQTSGLTVASVSTGGSWDFGATTINTGANIIGITADTAGGAGPYLSRYVDAVASPGGSDVMQNMSFTNGGSGTTGIFLRFQKGSTAIGTIAQNASTTVAYNTSSDRRLKHDIEDYEDALDVLRKVHVRKFKWNDGDGEDRGVIAQELQPLYPFAVSGVDGDDVNERPMSVDYGKLSPLALGAIKKVDANETALEAKVAALEARIAALEHGKAHASDDDGCRPWQKFATISIPVSNE